MFKNLKSALINKCLEFPKIVVFVTTILSAIVISGIPLIVQDDDMVRLLPDDMQSIKTFKAITDEFGNYEFMYIAMGNKGRNVFERDFLKLAWDITKDLENIEGCEEVISLSTMDKMYFDTIDSAMVIDELIAERKLNDVEIQSVVKYLNENVEEKNRLISKNNDFLNIIVRPEGNHNYADIAHNIEEITNNYKVDSNDKEIEYHFGGQAYITGAVPGIVSEEVKVLASFGLLLMTLILLINLKNIQSVVLILIIISLSLLSMLGFMGWVFYFTASESFYFTLNNTSMPIVLLTIANSDGVHIISRFFKELRFFKNTKDAIINTMDNLYLPISLTSITTMCAFLSLIFSPLEGMNGYGITLAFGIGWAWLLSLTMMPALISLLKWDYNSKTIVNKSFIENIIRKFGVLVVKNPKRILSMGLATILISIFGLLSLKVEVNMSEMFQEGSVIKDSAMFLDENMTGNLNLLIKASSKQGIDGMTTPENLKDLEKLQNYLDGMEVVTSTISVVDIVKQLHKTVKYEDEKFETIPDRQAVINALFFLYQMDDKSDLNSLMNEDKDAAVLTALMKTFSTSQMAEYKDEIQNFIDEEIAPYNNDLTLELSGVMAFLSDFIYLVIKSSIVSILISIVIIACISTFFYKSWKFGLLSIIPLFAAIIINFGLMGLFGIDLTHMTAILSSIIIGVGVDFSIHYTSEYKKLILEKKSNKTTTTINNVGHPIILDALSNMGFASLMLSTIIPMTQIGGLMVFAMCACSIGTLTLLASSIEIFKSKLT